MKTKITGVHIRNTKNIGDKYCHPLDYFEFGCHHDIDMLSIDMTSLLKNENNHETSDLVIVGGGSISKRCQDIKKAIKSKKYVAWGIGFTQRGIVKEIEAQSHYPLRNGYALYGTRDYLPHSGIEYVPCVSCMHQFFDKIPEPTQDVVVYSHSDLSSLAEQAAALNFPEFDNKNENGFLGALNFLASGATVVTSSYHGAYWATLLGRKVAMLPFGSKFMNLKYRPAIVESVAEGIRAAKAFPEALTDARENNVKFYQKVYDLLWKV